MIESINFAKTTNLSSYFQHFKTPVNNIELPTKFTFPFYYEPHPLSKIAATEVQSYLEKQTDFEHNFGINATSNLPSIGKMFGVLIVQNQQSEIGYIAAVSGKLANQNNHKHFVPPIYDMLAPDSHFLSEENILNQINKELELLEKNQEFTNIKNAFRKTKKEAAIDIKQKKREAKLAKKKRDTRREKGLGKGDTDHDTALEKQLAKESLESKYFLNNVLRYWEYTLGAIEKKLHVFTNKITDLKEKRATTSCCSKPPPL